MNKILRKNYPVSRLPEDLRQGLEIMSTVKVTIEPEDKSSSRIYPGFDDLDIDSKTELTIEEVLEGIRKYKAEHRPSVTEEEAVRRIRELRDEWDDE